MNNERLMDEVEKQLQKQIKIRNKKGLPPFSELEKEYIRTNNYISEENFIGAFQCLEGLEGELEVIYNKLSEISSIIENQGRLIEENLESDSYLKEAIVQRNTMINDKLIEVMKELKFSTEHI